MSDRNSKTQFIIDYEFEKRCADSFYDNYYAEVSDDEIKWRDFSALEKCESIVQLCKGQKFDKVVEVGCGLCNLISQLEKLDFAPEFYALEVSPSVIHFIKEKINIPHLKAVYLLDTTKTPFENDSFDLGILSHVLEHVPDPTSLLHETLRISKYVLVEVPLDDCLLPNLASKVQQRISGRPRADNPTGHINFFKKTTVKTLIMKSGGNILKERTYRSWKVFFTELRPVTLLSCLQSILFYLIFKVTNSKVVGTNYALLIRKGNSS